MHALSNDQTFSEQQPHAILNFFLTMYSLIKHQSCDRAHNFCCHHLTKGIQCTSFNLIPCLEHDIPGGCTDTIFKKVYALRVKSISLSLKAHEL